MSQKLKLDLISKILTTFYEINIANLLIKQKFMTKHKPINNFFALQPLSGINKGDEE